VKKTILKIIIKSPEKAKTENNTDKAPPKKTKKIDTKN